VYTVAEQLQLLPQKEMYKTPMYWCHQVLFSNWKSDTRPVSELLDVTEKDLMYS
jgi:hypothetical protein